jgi:hypothetical protein
MWDMRGATLQKNLWILVAILCALGAAGCSTFAAAAARRHAQRIPTVRALLSPQSPPDCEYRAPDEAVTLDKEVLARLRLEYERHCYQQAEAEVRNRLRQLQVRVSGLHEFQPIRHRRRFHR